MSQPIIINEIENRLKLSGGTLTGSLFINNGYAYAAGNADESIFLSRRNPNDEKYSRYISISSKESTAIDGSITFVERNNDVWKTYKLYGEHNKPSAADVGALSLNGGTLTGSKISLLNGKGYISASNTLDIAIFDTANDNNNRRILSIYDTPSKANLKDSLLYVSIVDGKMNTYTIYGTHNKPTAADVGALSSSGGTITGSLTISNATYNKSLSIGHGANDAFWYNSKSGKYVQHKDDGTFAFAGNQILDASNYTNYTIQKNTDKLPFRLANDLNFVNKSLVWNDSSYYYWVYLLCPCLTATNQSVTNYLVGTFYLFKNGANIFDTVQINLNNCYNALRYYIYAYGDYSTGWHLVKCKYNGVWYYALRGTYHANPYNRTQFIGHVRSDLTGGTSTLALPYPIAYYNEYTATVLNSEVYNSISTTLTDSYTTSAASAGTKMYEDLYANTGTTNYTTSKVRNVAANTGLSTPGNGDIYLVYT